MWQHRSLQSLWQRGVKPRVGQRHLSEATVISSYFTHNQEQATNLASKENPKCEFSAPGRTLPELPTTTAPETDLGPSLFGGSGHLATVELYAPPRIGHVKSNLERLRPGFGFLQHIAIPL